MEQRKLFGNDVSKKPLVEKDGESLFMKLLTGKRLEELYINQGKSLEDIAAMVRYTQQTVRWIMEEKGVASLTRH